MDGVCVCAGCTDEGQQACNSQFHVGSDCLQFAIVMLMTSWMYVCFDVSFCYVLRSLCYVFCQLCVCVCVCACRHIYICILLRRRIKGKSVHIYVICAHFL